VLELIEFDAPVLHFYTMSKPGLARKIAAATFNRYI
jgi:hypothetical protein